MTAGYYNYETQSDCLAEILKSCSSVLELGVGTGLLAEKLIVKLPEVDFVGIDLTESMLIKAQKRLGNKVTLLHENVLSMNLEKKFDAAFSNRGVWYFIEDDRTEYTFCSHLPKISDILNSFQKINSHLKKGGSLIFSVQGVHRDYETNLSSNITYSQKVFPLPYNQFDKHYRFSRNQVILAEQICRYQVLPEHIARIFLHEFGFEFQDITPCKQYHVYKKVG